MKWALHIAQKGLSVYKVLSLMRKPDTMTLAEFRHWATVDHPAYAHAIPGLVAYAVNVIANDDANAEFHVVTEVWFADEESFRAGFSTDAGKAAAAAAAATAAHRVRFAVDEHKVI